MIALGRRLGDATRRQWERQRHIFAELDALARRIRGLHPPVRGGERSIDPVHGGLPNADTPALFALADAIDAAVRERRCRPPFERRRTGRPDQGRVQAARHLRDLGATKREAADLLLHAGRGSRQRRLGR